MLCKLWRCCVRVMKVLCTCCYGVRCAGAVHVVWRCYKGVRVLWRCYVGVKVLRMWCGGVM